VKVIKQKDKSPNPKWVLLNYALKRIAELRRNIF
jgi:hypothetical protein